MSNSESKVDDLLRDGIKAARSEDKATARELLEQVVQLDQRNEKGWFWLAAVTDDLEEKRICLGNVLVINPNNQRAQRLLDKLEDSSAEQAGFSPGMGRINPKTIYLAVGLSIVAVIALILVVVVGSGGGGDKNKETASDSGLSVSDGDIPPPGGGAGEDISSDTGATDGQGDITSPGTGDDLAGDETLPGAGATDEQGDATGPEAGGGMPSEGTATGAAENPVETPSPAIPPTEWQPGMPPPAWTATPNPTNQPTPSPFPTVPSTVQGTIILQSGNLYDAKFQPLATINPDGSGLFFLLEEERGYAPVLSPDGSRCAYVHLETGMTRQQLLKTNNLQGSTPQGLNKRWGGSAVLFEADMPAWSPYPGDYIAFTAIESRSAGGNPDLYVVDMRDGVDPQKALTQLTDDEAVESWPAWSHDGQKIVYVAAFVRPDGQQVTELRVYDLATSQIMDVTSNHNDLIEGAPDWSPNGEYIVFHAKEADTGESHIYQIRVQPDGSFDEPQKIYDIVDIASGASDIQPRYSPSGQHIVFSSKRTGNWDVFIYEIVTRTLFQVTTNPKQDIANDWGI